MEALVAHAWKGSLKQKVDAHLFCSHNTYTSSCYDFLLILWIIIQLSPLNCSTPGYMLELSYYPMICSLLASLGFSITSLIHSGIFVPSPAHYWWLKAAVVMRLQMFHPLWLVACALSLTCFFMWYLLIVDRSPPHVQVLAQRCLSLCHFCTMLNILILHSTSCYHGNHVMWFILSTKSQGLVSWRDLWQAPGYDCIYESQQYSPPPKSTYGAITTVDIRVL